MNITKYLPMHLPTHPDIKSTGGAKRVLQEYADRETRKKVMVACLAVFCAFSLVQAKTNLLRRIRAELVGGAIQGLTLSAIFFYSLEISLNYFLPQKVTLHDDCLDKIDERVLNRVKKYVTDLKFGNDFSKMERYSERYTSLKRISFYLDSDFNKKTTFSQKALKLLQGMELLLFAIIIIDLSTIRTTMWIFPGSKHFPL